MRELLNSRFYIKFLSIWTIAILTAVVCFSGRLELPISGGWVAAFVIMCVALYPAEFCITTMKMVKPTYTSSEARLIEKMHNIPFVEEYGRGMTKFFTTKVMINIGGLIVPLILAFLTLYLMEERLSALLLFLISMAITYMTTEFRPPLGIVALPWIGFVLMPIAFLLSVDEASQVMLSGGVLGVIGGIIAWLLSVGEDEKGSAEINIGGYGNFEAIFLSVCIGIFAAVV